MSWNPKVLARPIVFELLRHVWGIQAILFCILVAVVRELRPHAFLHECTRLFPGVAYFTALLPEYKLHHLGVDPRDHGCPARRSRNYDVCVRPDMCLAGDGMVSFHRLFASCKLDVSVFLQGGKDEAGPESGGISASAF